jgi:hypothetical protein
MLEKGTVGNLQDRLKYLEDRLKVPCPLASLRCGQRAVQN